MSNTNKKVKLFPSIFKKPSSQWLPSCNQPRTLSFRNTDKNDDVYKTVNSVFLDIGSPESIFTPSSHSPSFSTEELSLEANPVDPSVDSIIQQIQSSNRLFFEPLDTSSILIKEAATTKTLDNEQVPAPFKESVALAMESDDPYSDFKKSMAEMVESHGLKDWDCLEELLGWYLKMNGKANHGYIVGAFMDLLDGIDLEDQNSWSLKVPKMQFTSGEGSKKSCTSNNTNTTLNVSGSITTSYSSAASLLSSPPCSPLSSEIEIDQGGGGSCRY